VIGFFSARPHKTETMHLRTPSARLIALPWEEQTEHAYIQPQCDFFEHISNNIAGLQDPLELPNIDFHRA
jgi:hypothetical protein